MTFTELSAILGNLGEFFGSIAVIVTLIYLAVQVRYSRDLLEENRKIALGQVSQKNAGFRLEMQQYRSQPHLVQIRAKVEQGEASYNDRHLTNFDQLTLTEKMQWKSMQALFAIQIDDGIYQSTLGLIDSQEIENLERDAKSSMPYWDYYENYVPTRLRRWYEHHKDD